MLLFRASCLILDGQPWHTQQAMSEKPLNPKHQRFVDEYLIDFNATKAYIRAGYAEKGAEQNSMRLMRTDKVKSAIEAGKRRLQKTTDLSAVWVLQRLGNEAVLTGEGATHSGRIRALELLGKHFDLFAEKVEHTGRDGGPIELKSAEELDELEAKIDRLIDLATAVGPPGIDPGLAEATGGEGTDTAGESEEG